WPRGRTPGSPPFRELFLCNVEVQPSCGHVELYHVPVTHQRDRAADGGLGSYMKDHSAIGRAAHAPIGDAHHVGDPAIEQLLRDLDVAELRHAGIAAWTDLPEYEDGAFVDVEIGAVEPRIHILDVRENDGASAMPEQTRTGRGRLDDSAVRGEVAG